MTIFPAMKKAKLSVTMVARKAAFSVILWAVTAWLLYPLIALDTVDMSNVKSYLYRSATGIVIMIIILGKTIFDLLFSQEISQKKSWMYTAFLTFYSLAITGGVLFMIARMLLVYVKKNNTGVAF